MVDFPTTHWSFITALQQADDASQRRMLGAFLVRYLPVFRQHLRQRFPTVDEHSREDILQGFVTDRILERQILSHVADSKGRLRSFLRVCLNHFAISMLRKSPLEQRGGSDPYASIEEQLAVDEPGATSFDIAWADQLLTEAMLAMKDDCAEHGRQDIWDVFDFRVLRPALTGAPLFSGKELGDKLGLTEKQIANRLVTAKRMLQRKLEDAVREYAVSTAEVDEELRDLMRIFCDAGSGRNQASIMGSEA